MGRMQWLVKRVSDEVTCRHGGQVDSGGFSSVLHSFPFAFLPPFLSLPKFWHNGKAGSLATCQLPDGVTRTDCYSVRSSIYP